MAKKSSSRKKQATRKKAVAAKGRRALVPDQLRVRIARPGSAECTLLTLPKGGGGEFNILVDCGAGTHNSREGALTREIVADIGKTTGGQIDLLVLTSPRSLHLDGFRVAADEFDEIGIGEVWLAWTEDPDDELAQGILAERRARLRAAGIAAEVCRGEKRRASEPTAPEGGGLLEKIIARAGGQSEIPAGR